MITSFIKKAIRKSFSSFGYDIVRHEVSVGSSANLVRALELHNIDLVLDVGANTGIYASALFAYGYKGRIVSFEPGGEAYGQLLARSQGKELWQVAEQGALGDVDSEIEINISTNLESSSILPMLNACEEAAPDARYRSKERVMLRSLDSVAEKYLASAKAPFLKLDVQGFEDKILAGAKNTLPKIEGVQIELSLVPLYGGQKLWRELVDQLIDAGFILHTILPGFTDHKTGRLLQMDGIFFRS